MKVNITKLSKALAKAGVSHVIEASGVITAKASTPSSRNKAKIQQRKFRKSHPALIKKYAKKAKRPHTKNRTRSKSAKTAHRRFKSSY